MDGSLNSPYFSIILPVYNGEKTIAITIKSVIEQYYTDWELIIIDDGSTDSSANIIAEILKTDARIKLIKQPNKKQAAARNAGFKIASGRWIAFIDADDQWLAAKLELQYKFIQDHPDVDVLYSDGYTKFHDKIIRQYYHYPVAYGLHEGKNLYTTMLFGNSIPVLSAVVKSEWVSKVGLQDANFPGVEDHDYWLRLCREGATFYGLKERLFVYNIHETNFSSNEVNQRYISCLIRIKNYDANLLNGEEIRKFRKAIQQYLNYFVQQNKLEWVQNIKEKLQHLDISTGIIQEFKFKLKALNHKYHFYSRRIWAKSTIQLLKWLYFHPRKKIAHYSDRFDTFYTNWLNGRNISNVEVIYKRASAQINYFDRDGSKFDIQRIYIGDYSIVNFLSPTASIIGGSDINIGKFCNINVVGSLVIGNNVLFNNYSSLTCHEEIVIGDNSWFGEGVRFYDHSHLYMNKSLPFTEQGYSHGKIEIGNNVWIGSNSVILQNVSIGDNCVIGANNVIYKSLPPNTKVKSKSMELVDIIER